ncbi:MAG: hypothetical protein LBC88_02310 [Spirochaetaceae bacterium]|jgi:hypothetical protein|nr:hypothetical protein [Spirochaetaceae bacterium]
MTDRFSRPVWRTKTGLVWAAALFLISVDAAAQDAALEGILPGFRDRALVLNIVARVAETGQEAAWNAENSRVTIPGRPIGIKLVGANTVIAVQFTPFRQNGQNFLVALGQIWVNIPGEGISYHTTLETIPLEFGESVYFFPLGRGDSPGDSRIEIQVAMRPYGEDDGGEAAHTNAAAPSPAPDGSGN